MTKISETTKELLQSKALAHIATIGPKGMPQNSPVWFDYDGTHIRFSLTRDRQKYHNIQRDPHIALSIVHPENPFNHVEIRGTVVRIDDDSEFKFIDTLAQKYIGTEYPNKIPGDSRIIVHLQLDNIVGK